MRFLRRRVKELIQWESELGNAHSAFDVQRASQINLDAKPR